jgi:hemoglobin/transferrin/lactoferrin receptor protein
MGGVMVHRSRSASALLAGVSAIALTVAGAESDALAQTAESVELDPITIISTQPVKRARQTSARVTTVRPPPPSPTRSTTARPPAPAAVRAAPADDPMPATETLGGVSTIRQEQINQLMPTRPADLFYGMPGVYVQERPDDPGTAINIRGL